jgi:hypothetical protein
VTLATEVHPDLLPVSPDHEVRCWLYHDAAGNVMPRPETAAPAPGPTGEAAR